MEYVFLNFSRNAKMDFSPSTLTLLFIILVLIVFITSIRNRFLKKPKRTTINLPSKIDFKPEADNNYGIGTFLLDVVTIGGHGRLKEARYEYEKNYLIYSKKFNQSIDLRLSINHLLNDLGECTYKITEELEKSRKLLKKPSNGNLEVSCVNHFDTAYKHVFKLNKLTHNTANTGFILLQGSAIGGFAAVGSWTLVSILGTASTGTAIASLSGAAAHNAILAWFGGGALAAGGGGMAAGTLTLGAIVALPIVLFSAYKTHSKADEIEERTHKIIIEVAKINEENEKLKQIEKAIKDQVNFLKNQHDKIQQINNLVYKIVYPKGFFSEIKRSMDDFLNQSFYTKEEAEALDKIIRIIDETYNLFLDDKSKKLLN